MHRFRQHPCIVYIEDFGNNLSCDCHLVLRTLRPACAGSLAANFLLHYSGSM
jgi:hypothetical protein